MINFSLDWVENEQSLAAGDRRFTMKLTLKIVYNYSVEVFIRSKLLEQLQNLDEKVYGIKKRKYAAHVTKFLRETRENLWIIFLWTTIRCEKKMYTMFLLR